MEFTKEQCAIIESEGDLCINAVAGSGKTTTIIEYAASRGPEVRILYLAFNRVVKSDALKKFAARGLKNVQVDTAHSLAYRSIVPGSGLTVRAQGYKSHELVALLKMRPSGVKHLEFILANHVNQLVAYYCNSDKRDIKDLNYADVIIDPQAKAFVKVHDRTIRKYAGLFLQMMESGNAEITHDYYLKKFQLSNPQLRYDYILFDEGQDASAAMLDIFLRQKAIKVIVGDAHQQIYSWRYAVNSLSKVNFRTLHLSNSFRFGEGIAALAKAVLTSKSKIEEYIPVLIQGKGIAGKIHTKAMLARTNLGLLLKAIEYVTETSEDKKIYFEGNIHSYTYADDGASLYDVLNLYNGKRRLIKDTLIRSMRDLVELEEYIENTADAQLGMMLDIVREYGDRIPGILKSIKSRHLGDEHRGRASVIFSTVHRCKGMEYDSVQLVNDFLTDARLEKMLNSKDGIADRTRINEEINLLYVAVTRAKHSIYLPESLLPKDFQLSDEVKVLKSSSLLPAVKQTTTSAHFDLISNDNHPQLDYTQEINPPDIVEKVIVQTLPANRVIARPWDPLHERELLRLYHEGILVRDLARHFNRTPKGISTRIKKLMQEQQLN